MNEARLAAVNVLFVLRQGAGRTTAIDKRPVDGPVEVGELGLAGDVQCDTRYHGGPDKALYAYSTEDAAWWAEELDRDVAPGLFGENLTVEALDVSEAEIGERWRIGSDVVVEVRQPRTPCDNLAAPGHPRLPSPVPRQRPGRRLLERHPHRHGDRGRPDHRYPQARSRNHHRRLVSSPYAGARRTAPVVRHRPRPTTTRISPTPRTSHPIDLGRRTVRPAQRARSLSGRLRFTDIP